MNLSHRAGDPAAAVKSAIKSALIAELAELRAAAQSLALDDEAQSGVIQRRLLAMETEASGLDFLALQAKIHSELQSWTSLGASWDALRKECFTQLGSAVAKAGTLTSAGRQRFTYWNNPKPVTSQAEGKKALQKLWDDIMPKLHGLKQRGVIEFAFAVTKTLEGGRPSLAESDGLAGYHDLSGTEEVLTSLHNIHKQINRVAGLKMVNVTTFDMLHVDDMKTVVSFMLTAVVFNRKGRFPWGTSLQVFKTANEWWPGDIPYRSPYQMCAPDLQALFSALVGAATITNSWAKVMEQFFSQCLSGLKESGASLNSDSGGVSSELPECKKRQLGPCSWW